MLPVNCAPMQQKDAKKNDHNGCPDEKQDISEVEEMCPGEERVVAHPMRRDQGKERLRKTTVRHAVGCRSRSKVEEVENYASRQAWGNEKERNPSPREQSRHNRESPPE